MLAMGYISRFTIYPNQVCHPNPFGDRCGVSTYKNHKNFGFI